LGLLTAVQSNTRLVISTSKKPSHYLGMRHDGGSRQSRISCLHNAILKNSYAGHAILPHHERMGLSCTRSTAFLLQQTQP
jgi:hypothetical protein